MSEYWTPSGNSFVCSATAQLITSASNQREGLARIVNVSATAGFIGFVSASATIGDADLTPMLGSTELFIAFSAGALYVVATGSPDIYAQAGYALK